jgi:hypothetical protein
MNEGEEFLRVYGPVQLATARVQCWKCQAETPVRSLVAEDVEEFFDNGDAPERLGNRTFVFSVGADEMPPDFRDRLADLAPEFKPSYSRTVGGSYWASCCTSCNALQGAFFLHSEPDGPFFGGPAEFKGELTPLSDRGFDALEASYTMT